MRLMAGYPIEVGHVQIKPLTLREILDMGERKYHSIITLLLIDKSSVKTEEDLSEFSNYDILFWMSLQDEQIHELALESFNCVLNEETFMDENGFYVLRNGEPAHIEPKQFDEIQNIIKLQNYLTGDEKEEVGYKPVNDKAREYAERLAKLREKIQGENSEDNGLYLSDLISIVATYSNDINLLNVWDLTIYQLYEIYIRLIVWDNYHSTYLHLPHLDEKHTKQLKHWARPVDINTLRGK